MFLLFSQVNSSPILQMKKLNPESLSYVTKRFQLVSCKIGIQNKFSNFWIQSYFWNTIVAPWNLEMEPRQPEFVQGRRRGARSVGKLIVRFSSTSGFLILFDPVPFLNRGFLGGSQ